MFRVSVGGFGAYGWAETKEDALALAQLAHAKTLDPSQCVCMSEVEWHSSEHQRALQSLDEVERSRGQNGYPYEQRKIEAEGVLAVCAERKARALDHAKDEPGSKPQPTTTELRVDGLMRVIDELRAELGLPPVSV